MAKSILKIVSLTLATVLLIAVLSVAALSLWLNTDKARQQVFQMGIELLQAKLHTKVKADSISIELLKGQVRLYGMQINDQEDSLLLAIDELHAGIAPHDLLDNKVRITDAELRGVDARLWRDSLTSNYQFIIDAFKKDKASTHKKKSTGKNGKMELVLDIEDVILDRLHARWDVRHKPRKNLDKPHRGAFDANHIDVDMSLEARVKQDAKGAYNISIKKLKAHDSMSGLDVEHLSTKARVSKDSIQVDGLLVRLQHSIVETAPLCIDLKTKRFARPFALKADILLQDIAQPFAPALSNFTTPLQLTTQVSGPLSCMNADDIRIQTPDKRLYITAWGRLEGLFGHKEDLNLQFRDIDMKAKHNMKEQIVMHFAKKMRLKMIRQMKALGDIHFEGTVDVLYKREIIGGKLSTQHGNLTTRFTIDGWRRYITGYLQTQRMDMGKLLNIDKLGPVKCRVDFDMNISKKTPRPATALPNGRLPMGSITAKVYDAQYSSINVPEVRLSMESDGSTAKGHMTLPGGLENMSAEVRYVQTDELQKVWFHFTHGAQQWLLKESVNLLKEKLQAEVEADSLNAHLFEGDAKLYGIRVLDQHDNPLFSLDTLHVSLNAQELMDNKVHVTHLGLYGLQAQLNKDSLDANFWFVLKSFKKKNNTGKHINRTGKKDSKHLQLVLDVKDVKIENMRIKWDMRDKPRKNQDHPHRGAFDTNHIDAMLNLEAGIKQLHSGGYDIDIRKMSITDYASGLHLDSIRTHAVMEKGLLHLTEGLYVRMPQSWIHTEPFTLDIKKRRIVQPFGLSAHIVLQDIAEPLVPILSNFTTPLDIKTRISGSLADLQVDDMEIVSPYEGMKLTGNGTLRGLTAKKDSLNLQFDDIDFRSDNETLMQMVSHFAKKVRLKMTKQMESIGNIRFNGNVGVMYRHEDFSGRIASDYGDIETSFSLNSDTHFMTGYLETANLDLGKFLDIKRLGGVNAHIDFNFNISSKSPRPATALPNGTLPQGHINAYIRDARYGILHAKKIEAEVNSDGSTASGRIMIPRKLSDLVIDFSLTQTEDEHHLKVRPKHKFHWLRYLFKKRRSKNTIYTK